MACSTQRFFTLRSSALPTPTGLVVLTAAAGVIVISSVVAFDGEVPGWERAILVWIHDRPDWLQPVGWVVQQGGVLLAPWIAGAVIAVVGRQWRYSLPFVAIPALKLLIADTAIKAVINRSRPFTSIGPEIEPRGSSALDEISFPSGHSTTAAATGILVALFLPPRWRPIPLIWAPAVGIGRLYYGEHNALDVIAGLALGTIFATLSWLLIINRWTDTQPPRTPVPTA